MENNRQNGTNINWDNPTKGQPHSNPYKIRISS